MAAEGMQSHDQSCGNCPTASHPATKKGRINAPILPKPARGAKSDRLLGKIVANFLDSVGYDIDIRMEDEGRPDLRKLVRVHEFDAPSGRPNLSRLPGHDAATVFERDGL